MTNYTTKKDLYNYIESIRTKYGLKNSTLNLIDFVNSLNNIFLEITFLKSRGLCGIAFKGEKYSTIILNSNRTKKEQNFDCGHELIHLTKHKNENIDCFQCFEKTTPQQNPYLEWQANEGSAELIMPYKKFIPALADLYNSKNMSYDKLKKTMANEFNVTESMIWCRIENLKYEFYQYYQLNKNIDGLEILSKTELNRRNINVKSINNINYDLSIFQNIL